MRSSILVLGLAACGSGRAPRFVGVLANDAVEQFDAICQSYAGGHAVRDPDHERANKYYLVPGRPLGDQDDSFACEPEEVGELTFDRTTRELRLLDLEVPEGELPRVQRLLRPALTLWEQIGLLGEIQRLTWVRWYGSHRGFFDEQVTFGAEFHTQKHGITYIGFNLQRYPDKP